MLAFPFRRRDPCMFVCTAYSFIPRIACLLLRIAYYAHVSSFAIKQIHRVTLGRGKNEFAMHYQKRQNVRAKRFWDSGSSLTQPSTQPFIGLLQVTICHVN